MSGSGFLVISVLPLEFSGLPLADLQLCPVLLDGDPESDSEDFNQREYHDEESIPDVKSVKSEEKPQFRLALYLFGKILDHKVLTIEFKMLIKVAE